MQVDGAGVPSLKVPNGYSRFLWPTRSRHERLHEGMGDGGKKGVRFIRQKSRLLDRVRVSNEARADADGHVVFLMHFHWLRWVRTASADLKQGATLNP